MTETAENLDVGRLVPYLTEVIPGKSIDIDVLQRGVNLTLRLTTDREDTYILQRPEPPRNIDYFADLEVEYATLSSLVKHQVVTPAPVTLCTDPAVFDGPFLVMTALDGVGVPWGESLPEELKTASARRTVAEGMIDTLTELHGIDDTPPGLDTHPPRAVVEAGRRRLTEVNETTGEQWPTLNTVGDWLARAAPTESRLTLTHGDYKPDNLLLDITDPGGAIGVIDWEAASYAHPLTDLGMLLSMWRDSDDPTIELDPIRARYPEHDALGRLVQTNEQGFWPFTDAPGSPSRGELRTRFEQVSGIDTDELRFFVALAPFTIATVWAAFHRQAELADRESHWGPMIAYMGQRAQLITEGQLGL